jgi:hypothetical protein
VDITRRGSIVRAQSGLVGREMDELVLAWGSVMIEDACGSVVWTEVCGIV